MGKFEHMGNTVADHGADTEISESRQEYVSACRWMLLARTLDDKLASLYRMGKIHGGVFLGRGQEAVSVAIGMALREGDVFAPLIRDLAGRLAFGEPVLDVVRTYMGSVLGPMRGRDGNVHRGRPRDGIYPMISHLGAMISVVNGALLAHRMKGLKGRVGAASIGDGGTSTGAFHEALNQAAVEKLPLVLVVTNNYYAYSTPNARQFACGSLLDRAAGYGVCGWELDGTNLAQCLRVLRLAANAARSGAGPQMVVATVLRLCGHGEHDDAAYVSAHLKCHPSGRDCLKVAEEEAVRLGWAEGADFLDWRRELADIVEEAVAQVQREPAPDPYLEDWCALASRHLAEGGGGQKA